MKEENIRKRSNDYRKDHVDAELKLKGIEARIKERTIKLCEMYPELVIDTINNRKYDGNYFARIIKKPHRFPISRVLDIMRIIEEHIDSLHPHQQQKMF